MIGTAVFVIVILLFYHLDKEYPVIMKELLEREMENERMEADRESSESVERELGQAVSTV